MNLLDGTVCSAIVLAAIGLVAGVVLLLVVLWLLEKFGNWGPPNV